MSGPANQVRIVGQSLEAKALLRMIKMCAASTATVLVTGESGTGKELVARALHQQSDRASGPFVPVNCAAIPRDLLESELFGHRKGAFSGAITDRVGRIELANGGTLFLDEIGDMSLDMQAKLLRVLQERVVDPIGSSNQVRVDVRVVAATHRDLESECIKGGFREDLYYRLNVLPILVPSLRDRQTDIPELLSYFAGKFSPAGTAPISFDGEFLDLFQNYAWPGNIRELSNVVQRLAVLFSGQRIDCRAVPSEILPRALRVAHAERVAATGGVIEEAEAPPQEGSATPLADAVASATLASGRTAAALESLIPEVAPNSVEEIILIANGAREFPDDGIFLNEQLADVEKKLIGHALNRAGGNITRTAQLLKLQRTTLIQKLNKIKRSGVADPLVTPASATVVG